MFLWFESAKSVWAYFANWFHSVVPTTDTIAHTLVFWRHMHTRTDPRHISFLIPCLIIWFIWSERNSRKHRAIPFRSAHVIWQVTHQLQLLVAARKLLPEHWFGCYPQVPFMPVADPVRRSLRSLRVSWRPPEAPWVKLNTDGSFQSQVMAGRGGLVRASSGELLVGFFTPLQAVSSFDAEFQSLLHGLRLAVQHSDYIWVEMDAAAIVSVLTAGKGGSAITRHTLSAIRLLCRGRHVRFSHIFREGNRAADHLASRGVQTSALTIFDSSIVDRHFLSLVRMDQLGYLNFRFQYS